MSKAGAECRPLALPVAREEMSVEGDLTLEIVEGYAVPCVDGTPLAVFLQAWARPRPGKRRCKLGRCMIRVIPVRE